MLDERELEEAVEIGDRAYRLLGWVNEAVERGFISLEHAGRYVGRCRGGGEVAREALHDLPEDARPRAQTGAPLRRFANYFSTYLASSFDLHEVPGTRIDPGPDGYCCPWCGYGSEVPRAHLQPKKLGRRDREKARLLKRSFMERLAREEGLDVRPDAIDQLLTDHSVAKQVALAAYGEVLLRRLDGYTSGPATLALWREFAWSPAGSPVKGFKLEARRIKGAEERVLEDLRSSAA
jgi:hypothetical protein